MYVSMIAFISGGIVFVYRLKSCWRNTLVIYLSNDVQVSRRDKIIKVFFIESDSEFIAEIMN